VLWNGGISFGGVIAFIFADLIMISVLDIHRKYYGLKIAAFHLNRAVAELIEGGHRRARPSWEPHSGFAPMLGGSNGRARWHGSIPRAAPRSPVSAGSSP